MAKQIAFKPAPVDFHQELMRKVELAPREHAEALLVLWRLLEVSHQQGILELAVGLVGGKDIIAGRLAEGAATPEGVAGIRNGIALAKILGSLDPEMLHRLSDEMGQKPGPSQRAAQQEKPPSLWHIFRQASSEDGRRGLAYATGLLASLGRSLKR